MIFSSLYKSKAEYNLPFVVILFLSLRFCLKNSTNVHFLNSTSNLEIVQSTQGIIICSNIIYTTIRRRLRHFLKSTHTYGSTDPLIFLGITTTISVKYLPKSWVSNQLVNVSPWKCSFFNFKKNYRLNLKKQLKHKVQYTIKNGSCGEGTLVFHSHRVAKCKRFLKGQRVVRSYITRGNFMISYQNFDHS